MESLLPTFTNNAIMDLKEEYHGEIGRKLFSILLNLLPQNEIVIPSDVIMSIEEIPDYTTNMNDDRINGFFTGDISLPSDQVITDERYTGIANFEIDNSGPAFQFMISTHVINNLFETLLGKNTVQMEVKYSEMKANGFPIEMTSN